MGCSMLWCDREESSLIGEMQGNVLRECCFGLKVKVVRGTRQTKWPAAAGIAQASNRGVEFRDGSGDRLEVHHHRVKGCRK
jgi:hypothetical protein